MPEREYIVPDWPAPDFIHAVVTTRAGGVSKPPFDSFNLADHVGDDADDVATNRQLLVEDLALPGSPQWLSQVHGQQVAKLATLTSTTPIEADASYTAQTENVCAVLTADCLPLLIYDQQQHAIAAAHAGWRGLAGGVIESTLECFLQSDIAVKPENIMVWLGPAISARHFEVGADVYDAFTRTNPSTKQAFEQTSETTWLADMYILARQRLAKMGVHQVYGGDLCSYADSRFYSYRRDKRTGRMASLIWKSADN